MAFRMKHWWAVVGAFLLAVLWMTIPPRTVDELEARWGSAGRSADPALAHRARLTRAARTANLRLQTARWADSLAPLVLEHGTRGAYLGLTGPDRPDEEVTELRTLLGREIEPDARGEAAVGVVFLPAGAGAYPGAPLARMEGYFFGEGPDGRAYCIAARSPGGPAGRSEPTLPYRLESGRSSLTGVCSWMHRYGMPGPEVAEWLRGPGTTMAAAPGPFAGPVIDSDLLPEHMVFERRGALGFPGGFRALSRLGASYYWIGGLERDRCLSGEAEACVEVVLERPEGWDAARRGGFDAVEGFRTWPQDAHLLATLESEFGPERFRSFWTSDAPVPEAFRSAFGEPLGEWVLGWYGRHAELTPPGPSPRAAGLLGTLAVLLAAGLLSTLAVRRWGVTG